MYYLNLNILYIYGGEKMALNKKLEKKFNEQINREFHSALLYLSMAAYLEKEGLKGFANRMYVQYQEELSHAQKFYRYVNEKGGVVVLEQIGAVKTKWGNVTEVFKEALAHEEFITNSINEIADLAMKEKDHASLNLLQWFISEQVEEEASVGEILAQLKLLNGDGGGMFLLDKDLSSIAYVDKTLTT